MSTDLHLETHGRLDGEVTRAWRALLEQVPGATPFHSPEWLQSNVDAFGADDVRVLTVRRDDEVIGIAPLISREGRRYALRRRWLELAGMPFADYGDLVVRPGCEQQVSSAMLDGLKQTKDWDACHWANLQLNAFADAALSCAHSGLAIAVRPQAPVRILRAQNFGARDATSHKQFRKLAKLGEPTFEVVTDAAGILDRLPRYFDLHRERFAARGMRSPFEDPRQMELYRAIARNMAPHGMAWLSVLSIEARPAAMRLSLRYKRRLHLYGTCFSMEFARYSPSVYQLEMLLAHAFANEIDLVDFGRGESPHKEVAGTELSEPMCTVEVFRSRSAYLEAQAFYAAQALRSRYAVVEKCGTLVRRLLPQRV